MHAVARRNLLIWIWLSAIAVRTNVVARDITGRLSLVNDATLGSLSVRDLDVWKLTIRRATTHSLVLLGERAWRADVRLYRWCWSAKLMQLIYMLRKSGDGTVTETAVEKYALNRNVLRLESYRHGVGP